MATDPYVALPPVPTAIVIGGETLDITPIKVGELPALGRVLQPIAAHLSASPDWLTLMAEQGDAVIDAVSIAARRPREWVAGLELDEAVRLAQAVFEVNADFFIRRLMPVITEAAGRIGQRIQASPGPMPSSV